MVVSTIKYAEDCAIGLVSATERLHAAAVAVNPLCISESSFEASSSFSTLWYYAAWIPNKLHTYHIVHISSALPLTFAIVGIAAATLRLGKETLSTIRQKRFLNIFARHAWTQQNVEKTLTHIITKQNSPNAETRECFERSIPLSFKAALQGHDLEKLRNQVIAGNTDALNEARGLLSQWTGKEVRETLEEIKNLDTTELQRALPDWLFEEITLKGGKDYLNNLVKKIYKGDLKAVAEGTELVKTMKSYAKKKTILHVIGMIGALVGIISCIGLIVAFPLPAAIFLLILVGVFAIASYVVRKGYVENPDGGFSFNLCLPQFMQKTAPMEYHPPKYVPEKEETTHYYLYCPTSFPQFCY